MIIKPISYAEMSADPRFPALIAEYAAECSIPEIGAINPQHATYTTLESAGIMRCFGVFADEELVGLAIVLWSVIPHYGRKVATLESLFVAKAHRTSAAGRGLMDVIEDAARSNGCVGILYSAPAGGQLEMLLDASRKYRRTNAVFYRGFE